MTAVVDTTDRADTELDLPAPDDQQPTGRAARAGTATPTASAGPPSTGPRRFVMHYGALVAAAAIYLVSLQHFDMSAVDGRGLVSAAPVAFWMSGALLLIGFAGLLGTRRPPMLAGVLHLVALIFFLHGTPGIVEAHPRFPTAWTHVGFIDQIIERGTVDVSYDARYNWPGAFSLGAYVAELTGLDTARALLRWAPVAMNLMVLAALGLITRQVTRDRRIQLAGMCLAVLAGWVGQDYLAPQAVAFIAYLTIIGVLLRYFRDLTGEGLGWFSMIERFSQRFPRLAAQDRLARCAGEPGPMSTGRSMALYVLVLLIAGVVAFSHQLTPFVIAAATLVLVVLGRVTRPLLPVTIVVGAIAWVAFGATTFLRSNLQPMIQSLGDLQGSIDENVQGRVGGSEARELVLQHRLGLTALVAVLAAVAVVRQWRAGRLDWAIVALAAVPAPLLALNSYGGEVLLRVLLFMIPFLAILAPFAIFDEGGRRGLPLRASAFALVAIVAMPVFVVARYGNESFERIHSADIEAWDRVVDIADSDTRVVVLNFAGPWRYSALLDTDYRVYPDEMDGDPTVRGVHQMVTEGGSGSLLLLGEGTARYGEVFVGDSADWQDELADELLTRAGYRELHRDGSTRIIEWTEPEAPVAASTRRAGSNEEAR